MKTSRLHLAYFISPHGFGHAARAAAVMNALSALDPAIHFEIFTRVPRWFFADSVTASFTYHDTLTDIGMAQSDALRENVPQTLRNLKAFLPFRRAFVAELAARVKQLQCARVLCDIAPLGIAVAHAAAVPSILIENFTWDWIYAGYRDARLAKPSAYLRAIFAQANAHIQTKPVCRSTSADLVTAPVSRAPRIAAKKIRAQLGIPARAKIVLITMGGMTMQHPFLDQLHEWHSIYFVVPGATRAPQTNGNVILLPHRSTFYHPDLIYASNVVIGKAGYSTVAEAYHAGMPFGYVPREKFRESPTMAKFIMSEMRGIEIPAARFASGAWLAALPALLALPRLARNHINGAEQIAHWFDQTQRITSH